MLLKSLNVRQKNAKETIQLEQIFQKEESDKNSNESITSSL